MALLVPQKKNGEDGVSGKSGYIPQLQSMKAEKKTRTKCTNGVSMKQEKTAGENDGRRDKFFISSMYNPLQSEI